MVEQGQEQRKARIPRAEFPLIMIIMRIQKKWVKEQYLDYIAPQIYWNIGFKAADYSVLVNWWKDVCKGTKVKFM